MAGNTRRRFSDQDDDDDDDDQDDDERQPMVFPSRPRQQKPMVFRPRQRLKPIDDAMPRSHRFALCLATLASCVLFVQLVTVVPDTQTMHHPLNEWKSQSDDRDYRVAVLANGLRVLVIQEPGADKAAAALAINAGAFQDPATTPGVAHFVEHLLFMGNSEFDKENEFGSYLAQHGGAQNAYTASDVTNYYFDIDADAFEGGFHRFASFFAADPLFRPDALQREMHAVDNEHRKNLLSDPHRVWAVLRTISHPQSPMHHFSTGALDTLNKTEVPDLVRRFYRAHYEAPAMTAVLCGPQSPDTLLHMAYTRLGKVPKTRGGNHPERVVRGDPFAQQRAQLKRKHATQPGGGILWVRMVPVNPTHTLRIFWSLPFDQHRRNDPLVVLGFVLGHEADGSLLHALQRKGWAHGLSTGVEEESAYAGFQLFSLSITLTDEGHTHAEDVAEYAFAYLALMSRQSNAFFERIFQEIAHMKRLEYKWKQKEDVAPFVTSLAARMQETRSVDDWLPNPARRRLDLVRLRTTLHTLFRTGSATMVESSPNFASDAARAAAGHVAVDAWETEQWYGARFAIHPVSESFGLAVNKRHGPDAKDDLSMPPSSPFLVDTDNIFPLTKGMDHGMPHQLLDAERADQASALWWRQDSTFGPRASFHSVLRMPALVQHPAMHIMLPILWNEVTTSSRYLAEIASYQIVVQAHPTGIVVSVIGFEQKLRDVVVSLMSSLQDVCEMEHVSAARFDALRKLQVARLQARKSAQPYRQAMSWAAWWTQPSLTALERQIALLEALTVDEAKTFFMHTMWATMADGSKDGGVSIESLAHGNILQADAQSLYEDVMRHHVRLASGLDFGKLPAAHSTTDEVTYLRTVQLPLEQDHHVQVVRENTLNADEVNSALLLSFQLGVVHGPEASPHDAVLLDALALMIREPCFDQLRTREGLGYAVFCFQRVQHRVASFNVIIMGSKYGADKFRERAMAFLQSFEPKVCGLTADTAAWDLLVRTTNSSVNERVRSFKDQDHELWTETVTGLHRYNLRRAKTAALATLSPQDLCTMYRSQIVGTRFFSKQRELAVLVYGSHDTNRAALGQEDVALVGPQRATWQAAQDTW